MLDITDSELNELFVAQLKEILWAEKQLGMTLAELAELATEEELRKATSDHLAETERHVARLKQIFYLIDVAPRAKFSRGMEGLLAESRDFAQTFADSVALDAALICTFQKVAHYEISTFGTLHAFAGQLGLDEVQRLLAQSLKEAIIRDRRLTQIATQTANSAATVE